MNRQLTNPISLIFLLIFLLPFPCTTNAESKAEIQLELGDEYTLLVRGCSFKFRIPKGENPPDYRYLCRIRGAKTGSVVVTSSRIVLRPNSEVSFRVKDCEINIFIDEKRPRKRRLTCEMPTSIPTPTVTPVS